MDSDSSAIARALRQGSEMEISIETRQRIREAASRIAIDWQLDPSMVEAELLRDLSVEAVERSFDLFDEIEERLLFLTALDKCYVANFWHEPRESGRSPAERLGSPDDPDVLDDLAEELWEAQEFFEMISG